jgi:hypothetical protein
MLTKIQLPKAFSVRDEHEFYPMQHLMARLNPDLMVKQVATGVHIEGGGTVFWGIVYSGESPPNKQQVADALREAGFDFKHKVLNPADLAWDGEAAAMSADRD